MSATVLERYRQRFEALKSLFEHGPEPQVKRTSIFDIVLAGLPFGGAAILEKEAQLRRAAIEYMEAMLAEVDALGDQGKVLHGEIVGFVAAQRMIDANRTPEWLSGNSGRSLDDWMRDRRDQNPIAPLTERGDDEAPGDEGGGTGMPPFIPPDLSGF